MTDDEIIEAAYDRIAASAPPPERVRARLLARSRTHHQRRAVLVGVGAAAAVTAVGVPVALRARPGSPSGPPSSAAPSSSAAPALTVPLRYVPAWLPEGVGERFRAVTVRGGSEAGGSRSWLPDGMAYPLDGSGPKGVTFSVGERIDDSTGTPVPIGDVTGCLRVTDTSFVEWTPQGGPTLLVAVHGLPGSTDVALRVARSVVATSRSIPVWLWSPYVPDRFDGVVTVRVMPIDDGWRQEATYSSPNFQQSFRVVAQTSRPSIPALYRRQRPGGVWLTVPADSGGVLPSEPSKPLTRVEAVTLLDELVCQAPDLDWVGSRLGD